MTLMRWVSGLLALVMFHAFAVAFGLCSVLARMRETALPPGPVSSGAELVGERPQ
jgi:hypothetical protein